MEPVLNKSVNLSLVNKKANSERNTKPPLTYKRKGRKARIILKGGRSSSELRNTINNSKLKGKRCEIELAQKHLIQKRKDSR